MRLIRLLKNDLVDEIQAWVGDGIISTAQAERIASRYGVDYHDRARHSVGYQLVLVLGYLFIGLAIITLVGANWDEIPRSIRMGGLITLTLGVNLFGWFSYRRGREQAAVGAFFLGSLCYGASIMLIAQIYHLGEHFPDGIYWWSVGVLPIALLLESRLLMVLAFALGTLWFWVEAQMHYYPASYPLLLLALAWSVLFRKQSELLFLGLLFGTVLWVEFNLGWWLGEGQGFRFGAAHLTLSAGLLAVGCCLASLLTYSHRYWWTDYGTLMRVWVVRLGVLLLLALSFEDLWREYLEKAREEPATHFAIAGICFGVSAAAHLASRGRWGGGLWFSVIYLLLFTTPLLGAIAGDAKLYQVAVNLLLIGSGVLLIRRGIAEGRSHDFYLGVSVILTTGLLRYIDLIGDYVGAAILFAVFAAILLGSARYWRIKHPVGDRPK